MPYECLLEVEPKRLTIQEINAVNFNKVQESIQLAWNLLDKTDNKRGLTRFEEAIKNISLRAHVYAISRHKINQIEELRPIIDQEEAKVLDV